VYRVLVVEDDETTREGVAAVLHARGYSVACATDGREGLYPTTTRVLAEVQLTFDPIENKLPGAPYEVTDPTTGERVTRYRDALVTVVEVMVPFLS